METLEMLQQAYGNEALNWERCLSGIQMPLKTLCPAHCFIAVDLLLMYFKGHLLLQVFDHPVLRWFTTGTVPKLFVCTLYVSCVFFTMLSQCLTEH